MSKYKPINGFTKEKILEIIRARPFEDRCMGEDDNCAYLSADGNKCAVGLFIPDGHKAQKAKMGVMDLLYQFPSIKDSMPLKRGELEKFQLCHDNAEHNAKQDMLDWVEENVE